MVVLFIEGRGGFGGIKNVICGELCVGFLLDIEAEMMRGCWVCKFRIRREVRFKDIDS